MPRAMRRGWNRPIFIVAQVYLSGAWHNVDATTEAVRPALIPIAVGRDAADVAMTTLWGIGRVREQTVEVRKI